MTICFLSQAKRRELASLADLQKKYTNAGFQTKHYCPEIHLASFVLPPWIAANVEGSSLSKKEVA
jgi:spermidine synthase